jgi:hypothetical protein
MRFGVYSLMGHILKCILKYIQLGRVRMITSR